MELRTRRLVNDSFSGAYHSIFKGRGIAFDTVRPYQPGDDVRDIDWNVTARTGEAFIKQYAEERELTVLLILDSSASCLFGSVQRQKRDLAAELGAIMALAAISNNDKVGLLIFSDRIEHYIAPRKGRNHVLRVIRDLLETRPSQKGTNLSLALQTINRLLKKRAIVFFMSDFLAASRDYSRDLLVVSRKHDFIAVILSDPLEKRWSNVGLVSTHDAETGAKQWIDTASKEWREGFAYQANRFRELRDVTLKRSGADRIDLSVDEDYVFALTRFFRNRVQQIKK
jgi:uncharacterized protein (DUF58 family)